MIRPRRDSTFGTVLSAASVDLILIQKPDVRQVFTRNIPIDRSLFSILENILEESPLMLSSFKITSIPTITIHLPEKNLRHAIASRLHHLTISSWNVSISVEFYGARDSTFLK